MRATREEIIAVSMMVDKAPVHHPIVCSCCLGRQGDKLLRMFYISCGQCRGTGFDYISHKTKVALKEMGYE